MRRSDGRFDLAGRLWDPDKDATTRGVERCGRAGRLLAGRGDRIEVADMMRVLRDHGDCGGERSALVARPDHGPDDLHARRRRRSAQSERRDRWSASFARMAPFTG